MSSRSERAAVVGWAALRVKHASTALPWLLACAVQIMPTLLAGGTLVIARPQGHMDPSYVASLIARHQVTSMIFTAPTLVRVWLSCV